MDLKKIAKEINEAVENRRQELDMSFVEKWHTYYMKDLDGKVKSHFPSVSKIMKKFYPPFNQQEMALKMSKGDKEKAKQLIAEWSLAGTISVNIGSRTHFLLEEDIVKDYGDFKELRRPEFSCDDEQTIKSDNMVIAGKKYIELMHERGAVLVDTEMILGDPELGYTGQDDNTWLMENKKRDGYGLVITDWKGLPLNTPILTNSGWKTMGSLTKTDKVFDKDGNLVKIKHLSQIKNKKCLKIKFDNNEDIISDFEHRWLVFNKHNNNKIERILTTQEIKDYYDKLKKRYSYKILKIDNPKPLILNEVKLPIDPYLFGVWLGDGHSSCGMITQSNEKVWDEIENRGYEIGNDVSNGGAGKASSKTIFGLRTELRKLNLLNNKHLPEIFLLSSYNQRLDILRGLMDSDGTFNKKRNRFYVSTTKECQVMFSIELLSSLGIKPTVIKYFKDVNDKKIQCYNIEFTTDKFNPFLSRNKEIKLNIKKDKNTYRNIVSVENVESVSTKCIEVDGPTNTFLCGKSLIVTHNTNQPKNFVSQWYTKKMYPPFQKYDDTALGHYYIQNPLYGRLLLKMLKGSKYENVKFLGGVVVLLKDDMDFVEYKVPQPIINTVFSMNIKEYL